MSLSLETMSKRIVLPSFEEMMEAAELEIPMPPQEPEDDALDPAEEMDEARRAEVAEQTKRQREIKKTEAICADLRREAEAEAARILEEAEKEAQERKTRAEQEAVDKVEGRYQDEMRTLRSAVEGAVDGFNREREALFNGIQARMLDLCISVAESIVHYELDKGDAAYLSIINNALGMLRSDETMVLHMPPVAYERIFGGKDNLLLAQMQERQVKVSKDMAVVEGDCLVSSERGSIRVGAHTQTARLRETVLQKWGEVKK